MLREADCIYGAQAQSKGQKAREKCLDIPSHIHNYCNTQALTNTANSATKSQ